MPPDGGRRRRRESRGTAVRRAPPRGTALGAGSGSSRGASRPAPGAAGRRRGRHAPAVHQLAPPSIVVAPGLGAPRQERLGLHRGIVGAVPGGRVRRAPADVEDLTAGIGLGLAGRTVGTSDSGGVGQEVRHRSIARNTLAISASHSSASRRSDTTFGCGPPARSTRLGARAFPVGAGRGPTIRRGNGPGGQPSPGGGPRRPGRPRSGPASRRERPRGPCRRRAR